MSATVETHREHWHAVWSERVGSEPRHAAGRQNYGEREVAILVAAAVTALDIKPTDALLDVGCSKRLVGDRLRPLVARYVGLDYVSGFRPTVVGDAVRLPFADATFDKVLLSGVLMCLAPEHTAPALRELRRVTREGGRGLVGSNPHVYVHDMVQSFDPHRLPFLALECGWTAAWNRAIDARLPQARSYFDMVVAA